MDQLSRRMGVSTDDGRNCRMYIFFRDENTSTAIRVGLISYESVQDGGKRTFVLANPKLHVAFKSRLRHGILI
jgi:hypothetical protein